MEPARSTSLWTPAQLRGLWLCLVLVLLYLAWGWFPLAPVEGDDLGMAYGSGQLALHGTRESTFTYRYDTQPLTIVLPALLARFTPLPPLEALCVLTILGFLSLVGFGGAWIARRTGVPFPLAALALLLFPETFVSSYYGNSNMIAVGFLMPALLLAGGSSVWSAVGSGVLFSLALFSRLDIVLLAPALAVCCWRPQVLLRWLTGGLTILLCVALLVPLTGFSLGEMLVHYRDHAGAEHDLARTLLMYATVFSAVTLYLCLYGAASLAQERKLSTLLLAGSGILPVLLVYRNGVTTPKYLLYTLPFFALLMVEALQQLRTQALQGRARGQWLCLALILLQYLVPWPTGLREQFAVPTDDGPRARLSLAEVPLDWHQLKRYIADRLPPLRQALRTYCDRPGDGLVLVESSWFMVANTRYELLRLGYTGEERGVTYDYPWAPGWHTVDLFARTRQRLIVLDYLSTPKNPPPKLTTPVNLEPTAYRRVLVLGAVLPHPADEQLRYEPLPGLEPPGDLVGYELLTRPPPSKPAAPAEDAPDSARIGRALPPG